jgi:hypothetical protein
LKAADPPNVEVPIQEAWDLSIVVFPTSQLPEDVTDPSDFRSDPRMAHPAAMQSEPNDKSSDTERILLIIVDPLRKADPWMSALLDVENCPQILSPDCTDNQDMRVTVSKVFRQPPIPTTPSTDRPGFGESSLTRAIATSELNRDVSLA